MSAPATVCAVALDSDLVRRLATAGRKTEEWRTQRDRLIYQAAKQGASLREIAAAVGLSNPGVLRVVRRIEAEYITPASGNEDEPDNLLVITHEENERFGRAPDS